MTDVHPQRTAEAIFDDFVNGRLSKGEWTHEAHLITAYVALRDRSPLETLDFLRTAIQTHNCGIGVANTETSGYHETLTRYYITAVAQALANGAEDLEAIFSEPTCSRTAALDYWSRDVLFSVDARLGWVAPDRAATPWPIVGDPVSR